MQEHTALIVDDNWYNRDLFKLALEESGYRVAMAVDGQEGLSMLEGARYDLLILDLQMPGLDGLSVLQRVRNQPFTASIMVLVITANPHMVTDMVEELSDHVMYKPIGILEFTRFVKRMKSMIEVDGAPRK